MLFTMNDFREIESRLFKENFKEGEFETSIHENKGYYLERMKTISFLLMKNGDFAIRNRVSDELILERFVKTIDEVLELIEECVL